MAPLIPDKLFFKIGEVAEIAGVRTSVLRYWETEFGTLSPGKSKSGQRLYSRKDVEQVLEIKRLLYNEKMTIEGARKKLVLPGKKGTLENDQLRNLLLEVRAELIEIRKLL